MLEKISQTISNLFRPLTEPVARWTRPARETISGWFSPLTSRFNIAWIPFRERFPWGAALVRWSARMIVLFYAVRYVFVVGFFGEVPSVHELRDLQTLNASELYDASNQLIGKFYKENRKDVAFKDLPSDAINALVATEDERYWEHGGIDYRSFLRVIFRSIISRDETGGGGSTISQQLAKNLYPRKKHAFLSTPINKFREMVIAQHLEQAFDKEELITLYLNTVPFGGNVFGIEVATKRFFNKAPIDLKTEESATLVGMLKANTTYHPIRNPERSQARRNVVLQQLVKYGSLTQHVCDSIKNIALKTDYHPGFELGGQASYFREYLRQKEVPELLKNILKPNGTPYDLYKDGLKIYSSLDPAMQRYAEEAAQEQMSRLQKLFKEEWKGEKPWGDDAVIDAAMRNSDRYKRLADDGLQADKIRKIFNVKIPMNVFSWDDEGDRLMSPMDSIRYYYSLLNIGFMAMDPRNGQIKAWVGGNNFTYLQYDHVRSRRQVGSTFKPIVYCKALEIGVKPCDYIPNRQVELGDWKPKNADNHYMGSYSMEGALTNSVNVISAQLIQKTGVQPVRELAQKMGVTSEIPNDATIALGTADVSLYDMIKVYSVFANRGKKTEPVAVLRIETREGKTLVDFSQPDQSKQPQIITSDHADMMTKMMRSVVEEGTAGRLRYKYNIEGDFAGKTGTTQDFADGWFMGFSPALVVGAWVGGESRNVRFRDFSAGQGAATALPVCGLFLSKVYKDPQFSGYKAAKFPTPPKWILDTMECAHKIYSDDERAYLDSMRLDDSLARDTLHFLVPYNPSAADSADRKRSAAMTAPTPAIKPAENKEAIFHHKGEAPVQPPPVRQPGALIPAPPRPTSNKPPQPVPKNRGEK